MDLDINTVRIARTRDDCVLRPGEAFLGGGTFLYSEPVPAGVTGLVDLTGMGWEPWSVDGSGLRVAGTCTLEELVSGPGSLGGSPGAPGAQGPYRALGIVRECVSALTLSPKVARTATVGGNLALGLPAGSMAGLFAALDAVAVVWTPVGGSREVPVSALVTGAGLVGLAPSELLREVRVPAAALGQRTAFRRAALTPNGRTAAMVTGRTSAGGGVSSRVLLVLTASVPAPVVVEVAPGEHGELDRLIDGIGAVGADAVGADAGWFEDTHGTPAWRAAMTRRLAHEVLDELGGGV
ncbi:CO/xanthine dehydrogenase FAD-binding subunit [Promicromonospora sp. AC04]|uniref:FAD binding domain-containing protein n=1 Tax=Promicromonospora sp. AC04 TaxID=2135723 RepID=UPI000D35AA84|nr:FAD binding domain-containing protein [Promicromonospora sp. AC04]PUB27131.1 CO/xanthine dehydrogenase FAD-binding subunit [Promicromonospora sp. AC04]